MSPLVFLIVGPAGGLGALARWRLDQAVRAHFPTTPQMGIAVVNVLACFLAGLAWRLTAGASPALLAIGLTGFLGGLSTFSTAVVDVVALIEARRRFSAACLAVGTLIAALLACGLGIAAGAALR